MATITQLQPMTGSVTSGVSVSYAAQLSVTGNEGAVLFETLSSSPTADLDVSPSGLLTTTGNLNDGTYTINGTTADAYGNTGTWEFTLTVTGVYTPGTNVVPVVPAESTGTEILFPFQIDPTTGAVAVLTSYFDIIEQHVVTIALTNLNERVMNPTYGGNTEALIFSPNVLNNSVAASDLAKIIQQSEPDIQVTSCVFSPVPGNSAQLSVTVTYTVLPINQTNTVTVTTGGAITSVSAQ